MKIEAIEKNGVNVFLIKEDIDINSSPDMKKYFDKVAGKKLPKVLLNFSAVNYVDSSGLATLVEVYKKVKAYGGALKLSELSEKVFGLFEITKLNKLFDISDKEEEAIASF